MFTQNTSNHEITACLEQAKKLQTLFISENPQSIVLAIRKLHEANILLEIQRDEWDHLCRGVNRSLESLKNSLSQGLSRQGKFKPDLNFYHLTSKKLAMMIDNLNDLRRKTNNQKSMLEFPENESTNKTFELLKQCDDKTEIQFQNSQLANSPQFRTRFQKQQALNNLELEKIQVYLQIAKLKRVELSEKTLQTLLKERTKEVEDKLSGRYKMLKNTSSPYDKLLKDSEERLDQEWTRILPLQEEMNQLQEKIKNKEVCPETVASQKELHFIFMVDRSKTMDQKMKHIENSINSLIQDRNNKDLYSLILFGEKVEIKNRENKLNPSLKISLPKPKGNNEAIVQALKQVYDLIDQSSSRQKTPMILLFTDCLESGWFGTTSFNSKMLPKLCKQGERLHSSFQKMGLLIFISYFDLSSQENLRTFALKANGGKSYAEGPQDNHDFLNHAANSQILPQIFRDLSSSLTTESSQVEDIEIESLKYRLGSLQASFNEKMKLIDYLSSERNKLLALKNTVCNENDVEGDKITNLYEEKQKELKQEQERSLGNLKDCTNNLAGYEERSLELQRSIFYLEKDIKELILQERISLPQSHDEKPLILNPGNVNVRESIEAFKKTKSMLLESNSCLFKDLSLLILKLEEISKKFEEGVNYESSQSQKEMLRQEANLKSIVGTGFKYGVTSPAFPETQFRRERPDKMPISESELLYQCSDIQTLIFSFLYQVNSR